MFVDVGQGTAMHDMAQSHSVQLAAVGTERHFDVAEQLRLVKLRKYHSQKLLRTSNLANTRIAGTTIHNPRKICPRNEHHYLRKQVLSVSRNSVFQHMDSLQPVPADFVDTPIARIAELDTENKVLMLLFAILKYFNVVEDYRVYFTVPSLSLAIAALILETIRPHHSLSRASANTFLTNRADYAQLQELCLECAADMLTGQKKISNRSTPHYEKVCLCKKTHNKLT